MGFIGQTQPQGAQNQNDVLIGMDGSLSSQITATPAVQYELTFGNVMEHDQTSDRATRLEQTVFGSHGENFKGLPLHGNPADQLDQAVRQYEIDLLIVGRCHQRALSNWFIGSTLDQLFRTIRAITLVV